MSPVFISSSIAYASSEVNANVELADNQGKLGNYNIGKYLITVNEKSVMIKDSETNQFVLLENPEPNVYIYRDSSGKRDVITKDYLNTVYVNGDVQLWTLIETRASDRLIGHSQGESADLTSLGAKVQAIIFGALGAGFGGGLGGIVGIILSLASIFSSGKPPAAYYKMDVYILSSSKQIKFVTKYYKNSNYTGYVKTITEYRKF